MSSFSEFEKYAEAARQDFETHFDQTPDGIIARKKAIEFSMHAQAFSCMRCFTAMVESAMSANVNMTNEEQPELINSLLPAFCDEGRGIIQAYFDSMRKHVDQLKGS